jgi:hypothetical protein
MAVLIITFLLSITNRQEKFLDGFADVYFGMTAFLLLLQHFCSNELLFKCLA